MSQPPENQAPEEEDREGFAEAQRRIEANRVSRGPTLDLRDLSLTTLPETLAELIHLKKLELSRNRLTVLPDWLGQLSDLRDLNVWNNHLTVLPETLSQLFNLQELDISFNQLAALPGWLVQLSNLQTLDVAVNPMAALPDWVDKFPNLQYLNFSDNQLAVIPESLGRLPNLKWLSLSQNHLTVLPESLGQLSNLRSLGLSHNRLTVLPERLGQLSKLQTLNLRANQLTVLPESLGQLSNLRELNLADNQVAVLPECFREAAKLEQLYLHNNPALGLPVESLGPTWLDVLGKEKKPKPPAEILEYYFRVCASSKPVLEARIIIIGDGAAGKTSLVRQLLHGLSARQKETSTRDVVIKDWPRLKLENPNFGVKTPVSVHLWDFGGQRQMHAAHPYFFTTRTLYLVVAEARKDQQDRVDYWMKMVAKYGDNARAVVVINKADGHSMSLDRPKLLDRYRKNLPTDASAAFHATSCTKGTGIKELKQAIMRELRDMNEIWARWPPEWFKVKESILKLHRQKGRRTTVPQFLKVRPERTRRKRAEGTETLNDETWRDICKSCGVSTEKDRDDLLEYLGHLGLVVCFPNNPRLRQLGVLNPEWVTRGIYRLLVEKKIAVKGGMLEMKDLAELLPCDRYPKEKHPWLVDLMKAFELVFEDDQSRLLLPGLLPVDSPDWAQPSQWNDQGTLFLELRYDAVLPESVISQFIVRRHKEARQPGEWWRHGIALKRGACEALVRAHVTEQEAKIELRLRGPRQERRDFLSGIRESLRDPKDSTPPVLYVILGKDCALKYSELLIYAEKKTTHDVIIEGRMETIRLAEVLDMVETPDQQAASRQSAVNVAVNIENKADMSKKIYGDITNSPGVVQGEHIQQNIAGSFNAQGTDAAALVRALREEFQKLPAAEAEKVRPHLEVIEASVETIEAENKKPQPRKGFLEVTGKGLLDAAKTVGKIAPSLIKTAGAIAEWLEGP